MKDLKEKRLERQKEKQKEVNKERQLMREDFAQTFGTEHGKRVLEYIYKECGFSLSVAAFNQAQQEISPLATLYNEGRRSIYLNIREHLNKDLAGEIETKELK